VYRRTPLFAVFSRRGTALVVPAIEVASAAAAGVDAAHVIPYGEFILEFDERPGDVSRRIRDWMTRAAPSAADALAAALDALEVRRGAVGLDDAYLAFDAWHRAGERLAPLKVVAAGTYFTEARRVKGPYELECLQRALHLSEEALNALIQALHPGMTEREAATLYEKEVLERGGVPSLSIVAFGERSALPAPWPSDRALRTNEMVRLEVGAISNGYHANVARTAIAGDAVARPEAVHRAIQAGVEAAIDTITTGVRSDRVFDAAIAAARAAGLPDFRRHHVGHGIGLEPFEPPMLAAGEDTELEAGMVLRVETPYYVVGWGGMTVMETVLVMQKGSRVMNRSARGLILLD
jgi:Xaa-Pro aminopeptidase